MEQVAQETSQEVATACVEPEIEVEQEPEERSSLSEKERRNEEVNERDNCSASSISSSSSTLEREEKEDKLSRDRGTGNTATLFINTFQAPRSRGSCVLASGVTGWLSSLTRQCHPVSGGKECAHIVSQQLPTP